MNVGDREERKRKEGRGERRGEKEWRGVGSGLVGMECRVAEK